jgi:hypothetical protein
VSRWTCPRCEREFDRAHQSHVCVPGNTVDDCFASRPAVQREIFDLLMAQLRQLGPVHVDAVKVGVFLKHQRKFAELRPMSRWLSLQVVLPYPDSHPRVDRRIQIAAERLVHVVKLATPADVDEQVNRWLADAYDAAG